jgi:hypothetical protein
VLQAQDKKTYVNINHQRVTPRCEDFLKPLEGRNNPQINKSYTGEAATLQDLGCRLGTP